MKLGVEHSLRELQAALIEQAAAITDAYWAQMQERVDGGEGITFRYAPRVLDTAKGRGVVWVKFEWFTSGGKQTMKVNDMPPSQAGTYSPGRFRSAGGPELEEIMRAESKLVPIRSALKQLGRLLTAVPALTRTVQCVDKLPERIFVPS